MNKLYVMNHHYKNGIGAYGFITDLNIEEHLLMGQPAGCFEEGNFDSELQEKRVKELVDKLADVEIEWDNEEWIEFHDLGDPNKLPKI